VASSIFREFDTMLPLLEAQEDDAVTQRMAEKR